jgi:adenylate kinase family enzyme
MLIIIIGLAGSGKTCYFNSNEELRNKYEFYDDFLRNFFDGEVMEKISERRDVCLADPRLCNPKIFNDFIKEILKVLDKTQIKLLLFENNPERCLINANKRVGKNVDKMIETYSKIYDLNNYQKFNHEILKVH